MRTFTLTGEAKQRVDAMLDRVAARAGIPRDDIANVTVENHGGAGWLVTIERTSVRLDLTAAEMQEIDGDQ